MAVVLIGPNSSGKSTLGNFLVNPNSEHQAFETAHQNELQPPIVKSEKIQNLPATIPGPLTIVDTQGVDDSGDKYLIQAASILTTLNDIGEIQACFFVYKFGDKIDARYRETVQYYSKLLPELFEGNTAIVMTDFAADERSIKQRERQGVDVEKVKKDAIQAFMTSVAKGYTPALFTIDCLPYGAEEKTTNLAARQKLLEHICAQTPVSVTMLTVPKTKYLRQLDQKEFEHLNSEISGHNERLKQAKIAVEKTKNHIDEIEGNIPREHAQLEILQEELKEIDTTDLIVVRQWSVSEDGKAFRIASKKFDLDSKWRIEAVDKSEEKEEFEWKDYNKSDYNVNGTVVSKNRGGRLHASMTLKTTKKERFKEEIAVLQEKIKQAENNVLEVKSELARTKEAQNQQESEIKELEKTIEEMRLRIDELSKETMSIEEATKRV